MTVVVLGEELEPSEIVGVDNLILGEMLKEGYLTTVVTGTVDTGLTTVTVGVDGLTTVTVGDDGLTTVTLVTGYGLTTVTTLVLLTTVGRLGDAKT